MAIKINVGAGDQKIPGFTSVDLYDKAADIQADICELPFDSEAVDEIVAYQVIEHVHYAKSQQMFDEMFRVLRPGGKVIVETPNIDVVCRNILEEGLTDKWIYNLVGEYYRPHDKNRYDDWEHHAGSIHRNPWNFERLREVAMKAGFRQIKRRSQADYYPCEENLSTELRK